MVPLQTIALRFSCRHPADPEELVIRQIDHGHPPRLRLLDLCLILVSGPYSGKWKQDSGDPARTLGFLTLQLKCLPLLVKTHLSYLMCFHHPRGHHDNGLDAVFSQFPCQLEH